MKTCVDVPIPRRSEANEAPESLLRYIEEKEGEGSSRIVDVAIKIDSNTRKKFLQRYHQLNITSEDNSYSGLLKTELTYYHLNQSKDHHHASSATEEKIAKCVKGLENCLKPIATLEQWINYPPSDKAFSLLMEKVELLSQQLEESFSSFSDVTRIPLIQELRKRSALFVEEIRKTQSLYDAEKDAIQKADMLDQLFCVQDGAIDGWGSIRSLGKFIADQLTTVATFGIDEFYSLSDYDDCRFLSFYLPPAVKVLSNTKSQLELRADALRGARYASSRRCIDPSLTESIAPTDSESTEKEWLLLSPYIAQLNDVKRIDEMISFALERTADGPQPKRNKQSDDSSAEPANFLRRGARKTDKVMSYVLMQGATDEPDSKAVIVAKIVVATIIEFFIYIPIHALFSVASLAAHFVNFCIFLMSTAVTHVINFCISSTVSLLTHIGICSEQYQPLIVDCRLCQDSRLERIDQFATVWHTELSIIQYYKKKLRAEDIDNIRESEYKAFLKKLSEEARSVEENVLNRFLSTYSGARISAFCYNLLDRSWVTYIKDAVLKVKKIKTEIWRSLTHQSNPVAWKSVFDNKEQELLSHTDRLNQPSEEEKQSEKYWPLAKPWKKSTFSSVLDVPGGMLHGMSDVFIDHVFRNTPALATGTASFSLLSLYALLFPASSLGKSYVGHCVTSIAGGLSKAMTGKEVASPLSQLTAVFLEWKTLLVLGEGTEMIARGHLWEAIEQLSLTDLDKNTLIVMTLIGAGYAVQFLKEMPTNICELLGHIPGVDVADVDDLSAKLEQAIGDLPTWIRKDINFERDVMSFISRIIQRLGEEAATCAQGTPPANFPELIMLSVQTLIVGQALIGGDGDKKRSIEHVDNILHNPVALAIQALLKEHRDDVFSKKAALKKAICVAILREQMSLFYEDRREACDMYDYIHHCFREYNEVAKPEDKINHKKFLHSFYNKYIQTESVMLADILLIPLYPIIYPVRLLQYWLASPSLAEDNRRSMIKDLAMFVQFLAEIARPWRQLLRLFSYLLRCPIGASLAAILSPALAYGALAFKDISHGVSRAIAFHHFSLTGWIRPFYAWLSREIDITTEAGDLYFSTQDICRQLNIGIHSAVVVNTSEAQLASSDDSSTVTTELSADAASAQPTQLHTSSLARP